MDFKEFVNKLEQDLKDALSEISPGADVRQNSVEKLQGTSYTGISITPADSHVGMNLNADQLFEQLQDGKSYEGVLAMAVTQVDAGLAQAPDVNVADIMNYETAKQMLCFDVVGTERNEKSLPAYADCRHHHAALSGMESVEKRNKTEYKKYIFKVTGKFSPTDSNR